MLLFRTVHLGRGKKCLAEKKKCFASLRRRDAKHGSRGREAKHGRPPKKFGGFLVAKSIFPREIFGFPSVLEPVSCLPAYLFRVLHAAGCICATCIFHTPTSVAPTCDIDLHIFTHRCRAARHMKGNKTARRRGEAPKRPNPMKQGVRGPQAPEKIFRFLT